jgi:hypothetical protein
MSEAFSMYNCNCCSDSVVVTNLQASLVCNICLHFVFQLLT